MKNLKAKLNAKKRKGFTIVELIVVMAIIAILTLIAVPTFTKFLDDANETQETANAKTLYNAAMSVVVDASIDGATTADLAAIEQDVQDTANIQEPAVNVVAAPGAAVENQWVVAIPFDATNNIDEEGEITIFAPSGATYTNGVKN